MNPSPVNVRRYVSITLSCVGVVLIQSMLFLANKVRVHLLALPEYKKAARISIYLSMPKGEISTRTIVLDALEEGKRVFVPYIYTISSPAANGPKSVMNMVSLHSKKDYESLHPNAWGIPTPSKATISERLSCLGDDEITLDENLKQRKGDDSLHMVVMPGVAFDRGLARLGHGKGYYDFFISKLHQQAKAVNNEAETRMPFLGESTPFFQTLVHYGHPDEFGAQLALPSKNSSSRPGRRFQWRNQIGL